MNDNYRRLYKEVKSKYEKVSQPQQLKYLKNYKRTRNRAMLEQILYANMPIIIDIACSFNRKGENNELLMDFISIGYEESIKCLDRYKFGKGNCTVTSWIRNNVRNKIWTFLREYKKVVKINTSAYDKFTEDRKLRDRFFALNGFFPTKGDIITKGDGTTHKFKDEYEFSIFDGHGDETEEGFFNTISDFDESSFIPLDCQLKNKIRGIAEQILTHREHKIIDLHYNKKIKMTDVNKYLCPDNEKEVEALLRTGKNKVKILLGDKKYIYNLYYSFFFNEDMIEKFDKGRQFFNDMGIWDFKNIYLSENPVYLYFNEGDRVKVFLNNKEIFPSIRDEKKEYKIFIDKKQGVILSKMHIYNIHTSAINKLRSYMLTYKISSNEYE